MCKHFVQLSISIGHFFEDQVYDWVTLQKTGSHTPTEITPKLPPPPPPSKHVIYFLLSTPPPYI